MFTPGRITHIDARKPLTPADVAAIEKSMDDHAVTVLPNQDIDDAQQDVLAADRLDHRDIDAARRGFHADLVDR